MANCKLLKMAKLLYCIQYRGRYCKKCDLDGFDEPWFMEFHHRDGSEKKFEVKNRTYGSEFSKIREELDKCDLLCGKCHKKIHNSVQFYEDNKRAILSRLEEISRSNGKTHKRVPFSEEDDNKILDAIEAGETISKIAHRIGREYDSTKGRIASLDRQATKQTARRHRLPKSAILKMYKYGYSLRAIGGKYNVSYMTIGSILNENGIAIRENRRIDMDRLKLLIVQGMSNREIGRELGFNSASIWRAKQKLK